MMPWEKQPVQEPDYNEIPVFLRRNPDGTLVMLGVPINPLGSPQDLDLIALQLWGPKT